MAAFGGERLSADADGDCRFPPAGGIAAVGGGDAGSHRREQKGQGHQMVSLPLLTPQTFLFALTHRRCAAKRGLRGLGSVRRADFETLSGPEFSLRDLPRITVRGQTVQGGSVLLRKAPLPSSVLPWSTRRPCGPLAFRRATAGSRVLRKGWGVKRGRETLVSLPLLPPPPGGGNAHAMSWRISPVPGGPLSPPAAHRCISGKFCVC